jgi:hypothetical protein
MEAYLTKTNHQFSCLALVFAIGLASTAFAQGRPPAGPPAGAGPPANINPNLEDRLRQSRESGLRSAEMDAALESGNEKRLQAAIAHMKEDFSRIQVLRNDIARNLVAGKPLDYTLVEEQTAEINKRAKELNTYMMARPPEDKPADDLGELKNGELVGALVRLCKLIDSFTENPSLKNAKTVDAKEIEKAKQDKARADQDLLAILKLSDSIQRKSDSLRPSR